MRTIYLTTGRRLRASCYSGFWDSRRRTQFRTICTNSEHSSVNVHDLHLTTYSVPTQFAIQILSRINVEYRHLFALLGKHFALARSERSKFFAERRYEFGESKLTMTLDYIFGKNTSRALDYSNLKFKHSRRTGRLKYVVQRSSDRVLFSLRPNGSVAPSLAGYKILLSRQKLTKRRPAWTVTVIDGVSQIVSAGKTVFCKHVTACSDELRAGEDVAVLNEKGELLAAGRAILAGPMIKQFKRGAAVKVRVGTEKNASDEP